MKSNANTTMTIDTSVNDPITRSARSLENVKAIKQADKQRRDLINTKRGLTNHCEPLAQ